MTNFFFNFIYYEVQSFIIDINIYGCFIHGFKDDNINQTMLVPMDLRNLIPEDHPCYFIKNVVDLIDCSKANQEFRGKPGESAYPRELLLQTHFNERI